MLHQNTLNLKKISLDLCLKLTNFNHHKAVIDLKDLHKKGREPRRGGQLRALNSGPRDEPRGPVEIEPRPGRLCVFYSQEVEHEVLPSEGERFAMTMWIWDTKKDASGR